MKLKEKLHWETFARVLRNRRNKEQVYPNIVDAQQSKEPEPEGTPMMPGVFYRYNEETQKIEPVGSYHG